MKRNLKTLLLLFAAVIMVGFISPKHKIVGKWTVPLPNGASSGEYVDLKSDGTYTVSLPDGKIGERGLYKLKHHVFSVKNAKDYVCGKDYWGKYRLDFHGDDSIHLTLIEDSCNVRRMDIVGYNPGLRRLK